MQQIKLTKTRKWGQFNITQPAVITQDADGVFGGYVWWNEQWHSASWDKSGKFLRPGHAPIEPHPWDLDIEEEKIQVFEKLKAPEQT